MSERGSSGAGSRERSRLEVHLHGGDWGRGEIPLDELARISAETQLLVRRLARALTGRSGPGTTPGAMARATQLLLVGVHPGSTVLEIAGPPVESELDLGEDVPAEVGSQALTLFWDVLDALGGQGAVLPDIMDEQLADTFDEWLGSLHSYRSVDTTGRVGGSSRRAEVVPQRDHGHLRRLVAAGRSDVASEAVEPYVAEGTLYAVNLHTGRFTLEDDTGHSFPCVVDDPATVDARSLLGQRVQAIGTVTRDAGGRVRALTEARIRPARGVPGLDADAFWRRTSPEELLREARPVRSLDDLVIDDLTEEEEAAFLQALQE
jgi:hypothetical protein